MTSHTSDALLSRMMTLHPKVIDLTLDRVWKLLDRLGNPQDHLPPTIHIAGTNGKGSTLAMIRAGLESAGKTCHVFTSPHLIRFHERIRVSGDLISEEDLSVLLDECDHINAQQSITFFEITTCAALLAFARQKADYCLLEVGLGGRLDATNVIERPVVTVVTPVSMDHEAFLGNTLSEIAHEKAGILKPGVPCVVGPQAAEVCTIIEKQAQKCNAVLHAHNRQWSVSSHSDRLLYRDEYQDYCFPEPNLIGPHQIQNAGTAIAVLQLLNFDTAVCAAALTSAEWPGRMQRLQSGPLVTMQRSGEIWVDGGHNPAAGMALAQVIKGFPTQPTYLVCGMQNSKDVAEFLRPMMSVIQGVTAVTVASVGNSHSTGTIMQAAQNLGIKAHTAPSVTKAVEAIFSHRSHARVVICGSLHLVGEVLSQNS